MADSIGTTSSAGQIASNYEKYKEFFATDTDTALGQSDFLSLMTEQMKNQDFMNPTDNTEFIAQLAQFTSLQQMQQMTYYSTASYATSLVGKTVSVASTSKSGEYNTDTGIVSSVRLNGDTFEIIVNGSTYTTKNVMEILAAGSTTTDTTTDTVAVEEEEEEEDTIIYAGSLEVTNAGILLT